MPPPTPRTTRAAGGVCDIAQTPLRLGRLELDEVVVDLTQGDRQRLLLRRRLDQRAHVLQQAFAELAVVGIDLPCPLCRDDDERVLRLGTLEQLVDRRVGDAFGTAHSWGHVSALSSVGIIRLNHQVAPCCGHTASINATNSAAARRTSSFTTTASNSPSAASSILARSSRDSMTARDSVPRPISRRSNSSQDGGVRKTNCASGMLARTCRAPCNSISSSVGTPAARCSNTGARGVP